MSNTHGKRGILYKWNGTAANLTNEATTVSSNDAQITDAAKRILNPNATITVTPTNSVSVIGIDLVNGTIHFDGAPGVTTVSGTNAYIPTGNLVKTGYLFEWGLDFSLEEHDITEFQDDWKAFAGGLAEASGSAQGFMVGSNWWDDLEDETDDTMSYWFLELFTYDPDNDRTGDHYDCWAVLTGLSINVPLGEFIKETVTFRVHGYPVFVANV